MEKSKNNYYGTAGFETVPFSYHLTQLINEKGTGTFKVLTDSDIKEITIVPSILKKPISYDSLEFCDFEISKFLGSGGGFSQVFLGKCKTRLPALCPQVHPQGHHHHRKEGQDA